MLLTAEWWVTGTLGLFEDESVGNVESSPVTCRWPRRRVGDWVIVVAREISQS
jgi:hypothetical protein